jgi:long-chain acyl-CoA synthetase
VLWEAFHARTGRLGHRVAVSAADAELTFGALWSQADRLSSQLRAAGVGEGAVVGLALPNTSRFVVAFLALCRVNATVALVSPQYGPVELRSVIAGTGAECLVTEPGFAAKVADAVPVSRSINADGLIFLLPALHGGTPALVDTALLKFSSGSTAEPKGIALSAESVLAEARNVTAAFGLGPEARVLAGVPVVHSYGFDLGVLQTVYAGTTLLLQDTFVPRRSIAALASGELEMFLGVPAQYRLFLSTLLAAVPNLAATPWLLSCTAPLGQAIIRQFHARFGTAICQHYGSSETGAVTTQLPAEALSRPASVGRPMPGVHVTVRAPDGRHRPAGAEGEVVVSSAAVGRGYVLGAPSGPSPFREGAFWTGDVGWLDEAGFLTVLGRSDSMINVGGLKVSPTEVAAVLESHPAVREAAVIGVPDGRGEQVAYAVVTLREPSDEQALLALCRSSLAEHKVPRRIEIRDSLPRTASGKVRIRLEDLAL